MYMCRVHIDIYTQAIRIMFEIKHLTIGSSHLEALFVIQKIVVTLLCVRSCLRPMSIKIRKAKNYASALGIKIIANAV